MRVVRDGFDGSTNGDIDLDIEDASLLYLYTPRLIVDSSAVPVV